jgi:PhoD-like phosphatase
MPELIIGPMQRYVDETSATIFVETDGPCLVSICGTDTYTFEVASHHYALTIIEGLKPGSITEYRVALDGVQCWPSSSSEFPVSVIRTLGGGTRPLRLLFGSCRAAAPHIPPFSLSATQSSQGLGVDSLRAHGLRMKEQPASAWPDLLLLLGDQVYADEPSPKTASRLRSRWKQHTTRSLKGRPKNIVQGFEDYTSLYRESWQSDVERWVFSVVPSAMIFDDHDMVDDWNISARWVKEMRAKPWWEEHMVGALMSYWIYQHLGNLSPTTIRSEGILAKVMDARNGGAILHEWALESDRFTPIEGGYRFSFVRDFGRTRIVVVDCRNARVLEPYRAMVGVEEWNWVDRTCRTEIDHLLIGASVPVMVPGGLHGLQIWNAALCDGAWGPLVARFSERLRRFLDLEDWPAFEHSFAQMLALISEIATGTGSSSGITPPAVIAVLSGDIHFSYVAEVSYPAQPPAHSRVYQLVSSPIRNTLSRNERRAMNFGMSKVGWRIGRILERSVRVRSSQASWKLTHGPEFANELGALIINERSAELVLERARPDEAGRPILEEVVRVTL